MSSPHKKHVQKIKSLRYFFYFDLIVKVLSPIPNVTTYRVNHRLKKIGDFEKDYYFRTGR